MVQALATQRSSEQTSHRRAAFGSAPATSARPSHLRPVPAGDAVSAELDRIGTVMNYARGRMVIEEGNPAEYVYKVVGGALRSVRLLPDGRRCITNFLLPGDFFGFTESREYLHTVEAIADATVVRYSRRGFEVLLEGNPRAGRRFFGLMCQELSVAQDRLLLLGRKHALERLATFLLAMADRKSSAIATGGNAIELPMNRTDVADYLGLTVETVSRLLTQLRGRRIIDLPTANHVVILKRDDLEDISSSQA